MSLQRTYQSLAITSESKVKMLEHDLRTANSEIQRLRGLLAKRQTRKATLKRLKDPDQ